MLNDMPLHASLADYLHPSLWTSNVQLSEIHLASLTSSACNEPRFQARHIDKKHRKKKEIMLL